MRESAELAKHKPQITKRDVGCDTDDLPQLVKAKGRDVGCGTDDLTPLPVTNETKGAAAADEKPSAYERETRKTPENLSDKVNDSQKGTLQADEVKQQERATETVKDKTPVELPPLPKARNPAADVTPPLVFPSSDCRYKQKPMEGYTVNPSIGKQLIHAPAGQQTA